MTFLKTIKSVGSTAGKSIRPNVIRFDYKQIPPVVINHEVSVKYRDSLAEKEVFSLRRLKTHPPLALGNAPRLPRCVLVSRGDGTKYLGEILQQQTFITPRGGGGRYLNSFPNK